MKNVRVIPIYIFYIAYFFINFIISFALLRGWFNPNISPDTSFGSIILSMLGDLGVLTLVFSLVLLIFKSDKNRIIILTVVSAIFNIFIIFLQGFSNMFYTLFSYTQLISFKNPSQGKLIGSYVNYFLAMFKEWNILFPLLLMIGLFILQFFIKNDVTHEKKVKKQSIMIGSSLIAMIIPLVICVTGISGTANSLSMNGLYGCSQMGTYNYYIYSIKDVFPKTIKLDNNLKAELTTFLSINQYNKDTTNPYFAKYENKNLIIVQLEAINNFVINLKINDELISPNLTSLSQNGYYSNRFYSIAGMGNTSDIEFSSLTGLYPNGNDLSIFSLDGENYPSIAKEFSKLGYETFSIHGNDGEFYNRNYQHVNLFGFDEHIDKEKLLNRNSNLSLIHDWISDDALLQESINIYEEKTNPFFSYNILVSSHAPFGDSKLVTKFYNKDLTSLANDYIGYVKYVDDAIGKFIKGLKEANLYDDSIIVLYGDHTSSLLESDVESITNKNYSDVQYRLEMQNVPFIMLGSEIETTIDNSVRCNIDIFPTVANLFNLNPQYKFGANMLSNEVSYVYNPRSLDIIFNDYTILVPSKSIKYNSKNSNKLTNKEIKNVVKDFQNYKYLNDLLVSSNYFK